MVERLHIFYADEYIGELEHDTNGDTYKYESKSDSKGAKMWVFLTNADTDRFKETLYDTRVFPPERVNARELLHQIGLIEYDPWEIMKRIHFVSDDFFWAHKEMKPELFWTKHPLASYHKDYEKVTGLPMYSDVPDADNF